MPTDLPEIAYPSPVYRRAVELALLCYRAIDADYRQRYRMKLWQQVEARIKVAAMTSPTLPRWVQAFLTFPHTEVREPQTLNWLLLSEEPREILRIYREEPTVVVAFLRAELEAART